MQHEQTNKNRWTEANILPTPDQVVYKYEYGDGKQCRRLVG